MMTEVEDGEIGGSSQLQGSGQPAKELPPPDVTSHETIKISGNKIQI